ncbi:MAG TPA: DUF72 domain-containing protein [Stellaceae bacterium]|nr:DUF72 domain-containing protein [Stellaceae bacterium]
MDKVSELPVRIGCAGWTIPGAHASSFPGSGSHLERYARRFAAVEINSSFYRAHRRATYERWAAAVPDDFAFAVKVPREITHRLRLGAAEAALDAFLEQVAGLGDKLGPLLVQLPPSLRFDGERSGAFFAALRRRFDGDVVCEPRHPDWFTARVDALMADNRVSRAAADPPVVEAAARPGGWNGLRYLRLHGSPRLYYSEYRADQLERFMQLLAPAGSDRHPAWCIFDNTAAGAAIVNALALQQRFCGY